MSKTPFSTLKQQDIDQTNEPTNKTADSKETDTIEQCPECDGTLIQDAEHGETVCRNCGLVVEEEAIDHGPEWRSFEGDREQKSRVGAPTTETMHDKGLSTKIGWQNRDSKGNSLSSKQRRKMSRLRKWDQRTKTTSSERGLREALTEIQRMVSALAIPDSAEETACAMFRRAQKDDLLLGRSIEAMASGTLYAAARMEGIPRTPEEIAHVSRVDKREINRAYWYLNKKMNLKVGPTDPLQYIPRFVTEVEATDETERIARDWITRAKETNAINGNAPSGIAAAALYAAGQLSGDTITQDEVADAAGVTPVTIRNQFNNLIDHADLSWL